ncbi:rho guanine nucleotide exchange factor 8-like [Cynara cardunculus var. scolymus]|uniref:rho guanine nucleotide exchange factor 8-like n=1 Tax=Cynara cardunculus var. scolymus TaxID=59895 RepID=UPI000D630022|nr:rho guanine nucleotide exchange factor 8-like [Cynara cardunculus var. scolymus]
MADEEQTLETHEEEEETMDVEQSTTDVEKSADVKQEDSSTSDSDKSTEQEKSETVKEKLKTGFVDLEQMKEKFSKLLLGEDMSGGGKGVSSALALSNAITNLAASVFGEQRKLEPMPEDRKMRWRKEVRWLLSVTDHIVEFVPYQHTARDGSNMEIMVTKQRKDLLMNIPALQKLDKMLTDCLDNFKDQKEFWYVSKDANESEKGVQRSDKWWLPTVKVPPGGLSEESRKWMQKQKDCANQVLKASMAINAEVLAEMEIPENYIDDLPKNGRDSLGDAIYKSITVEFFDPGQFLATIDLSSEHKILDLKNKMEASIVIWKRKMHQKESRSWGSSMKMEKRELFEERAETVLLLLKQRFPGLPQSSLDICKIESNKDVGHAVLESYSRVLESLANTVMNRIEDVLYADELAQNEANKSPTSDHTPGQTPRHTPTGTPTSTTISDFMGLLNEEPTNAKVATKPIHSSKRSMSYYTPLGLSFQIVT